MESTLRIRPRRKICVAPNRPSLLDPRLRGDPWVARCTHPDLLVIYYNNQPVNLIPGTLLELASLNTLLFQMRNRYPRQVVYS